MERTSYCCISTAIYHSWRNPFYQSFTINLFYQSYQFYHTYTNFTIGLMHQYIDWWRQKKCVNTAVYHFGVWINSVRRNVFNQSFGEHTHYLKHSTQLNSMFVALVKFLSLNSGIVDAIKKCPMETTNG